MCEELTVQAVAVRDVQVVERAVGNDGIDVPALQFELIHAQYKGRVDGDTAEDHAVSARRRDKMSGSLVDEDDVAAGHGEIVLVACDVRLSFLDILKFNLLVPVPVYGRGIRRAAVDGGEVYGISAEKELLCALFIKIGFHKMSSLFYFIILIIILIDSCFFRIE